MIAQCKLCGLLIGQPGMLEPDESAAMAQLARAAYDHICSEHLRLAPVFNQVLTLATHWLASLILEGRQMEPLREQMRVAVHAALDGLVLVAPHPSGVPGQESPDGVVII